MARLQSSWDLRSRSSPRSLLVYQAPTIPMQSLSSRNNYTDKNQQNSSSNTIDSMSAGNGSFGNDSNPKNPFDTGSFRGTSHSSPQKMMAEYSVVFGTERSTLHHRAYSSSSNGNNSNNMANGGSRGNNSLQQPLGHRSNTNVHPLHQPVDTDTNVSSSSSPVAIEGCVRATLPTTIYNSTLHINIFLLLKDDNRGANSSNRNSPGAFVASLFVLDPSKQSFAPFFSLHGIANSHNTDNRRYSPKSLPRMSCASYDPASGYVYAAGTSIMSLAPSIVFDISNALQDSLCAPKTRRSRQLCLPTICYYAKDILPTPGARSITLTCSGKVCVAAVGNTFYAINGIPLTKDWSNKMDQNSTNWEQANIFAGGDIGGGGGKMENQVMKIFSFAQSSQVHQAIAVTVPIPSTEDPSGNIKIKNDNTIEKKAETALLFLASGRECAVVEILHNSHANTRTSKGIEFNELTGASLSQRDIPGPILIGAAKHGIATLASPILAAVGLIPSNSRNITHNSLGSRGGPLVAVLTSDGLVHTRSPACISVPLSTIEVGTRPNDFFVLHALVNRRVVAASYSGQTRVVAFRSDTQVDLADRLMKLSIDAFGAQGFPRSEVAESLQASFSATSYLGPEPTEATRNLLTQYLEAVLGLDLSRNFGESISCWKDDDNNDEDEKSAQEDSSFQPLDSDLSSNIYFPSQASLTALPATFVPGTALLCLVCSQLNPPNFTLANRAAKSCSKKIGIVNGINVAGTRINAASVQVCEIIVASLLKSSSTNQFSLLKSSTPSPIQSSYRSSKTGSLMELIEASVWLLRSCGRHEHAIKILQDRMNNPAFRNQSPGGASGVAGSAASLPKSSSNSNILERGGTWSQKKYETYTSSHLSELWSCGDIDYQTIVIQSSATRQLLENNPRLGLGIFINSHPQTKEQWDAMVASNDPFSDPISPMKVVKLLKSIKPSLPYSDDVDYSKENFDSLSKNRNKKDGDVDIPFVSGRALAVAYLESAIGISTGRSIVPTKDIFSTLPLDEQFEEQVTVLHDELAYLLLEGVISERSIDYDKDVGESKIESFVGKVYQSKLRRFLSWPNAKIRSERLISSLPSSFLSERALLLGRIGRHEDALRILYCDLKNLKLALTYCDNRYEKQQSQIEQEIILQKQHNTGQQLEIRECAYLPLISVALESESESESDRGVAAAIQVMSLRRNSIDCAAALRLLPDSVHVSAVARSFLIPAIIDSDSQVRRLKVLSSLLREKYVVLKRSLTDAQIKSQSVLSSVPAFRTLNLGEPIHSSKPVTIRPSHISSSYVPDIIIVKHFFQQHVVIQAKVTNVASANEGRTLDDVAFVVAESSDEALLPSLNIPLKTLPPARTGCSWFVLTASPQRLDGTATLACELRFTILAIDAVTGAPLNFSGGSAIAGLGRHFVEELQDIKVHHTEFTTTDILPEPEMHYNFADS